MVINKECWCLYLRQDAIDWVRYSPGEITQTEGSCSSWSELPLSEGAEVLLCVPGEYVRIHSVSIPTRKRKRFLAALPYALEEQLIRSPDTYHFVPLPKVKHALQTPVAVVAHEKMASWLESIQQQNWRVKSLVPDYLALSAPVRGSWLLDVTAQPMLLRQPFGEGGATFSSQLCKQVPGELILALEQTSQQPRILQVRVVDDQQLRVVNEWEAGLAAYGITLKLVKDDLTRAARLAKDALAPSDYNLLRGKYAPTREMNSFGRRFVPTVSLAAGLLIVVATQWLMDNAHVQSEHENLQQEITRTYMDVFPDAKNLVDPRYQMEQRLARLTKQQNNKGQSTGMLALLEQLSPILTEKKGSEISAFEFDGDSFVLEISVPDFSALSALQERIAKYLAVDIRNAELREGRVFGQIRIGEQA